MNKCTSRKKHDSYSTWCYDMLHSLHVPWTDLIATHLWHKVRSTARNHLWMDSQCSYLRWAVLAHLPWSCRDLSVTRGSNSPRPANSQTAANCFMPRVIPDFPTSKQFTILPEYCIAFYGNSRNGSLAPSGIQLSLSCSFSKRQELH